MWPIAVSSFGPVAAGTLLWTHAGVLRTTLVLRTAYPLGAGALTPVPPGAIERVDSRGARDQSDPAAPVRWASDLVPHVPYAEIIHAGAVVSPETDTAVRLSVVRQGHLILDKRVVVSAKAPTTGLGPIGPEAPARVAALRGDPAPSMDPHGALAHPDDFDFAFYQCAPVDQRIEALFGGDRIVASNLHPDLPEVTVTMPIRAPLARATLGKDVLPLPLRCVRVMIETDRRMYVLLWLAEFYLPSVEAVPYVRVEARAPAPEPAPPDGVGVIAAAVPRPPPRPSVASTVLLEDGRAPAIASTAPPVTRGAALPFVRAPHDAPPSAPSSRVATPWGGLPLTAPPAPSKGLAGTLDVAAWDELAAESLGPIAEPAAPHVDAEPVVVVATPEPAVVTPSQAGPWAAPAPEREAPSVPSPSVPSRSSVAQPKGPAAFKVALNKDSNERFKKR